MAAADFYVDAVDGNDAYPGTLTHPVRTLERVRDMIRTISTGGLPPGGVTVWLRAGFYERSTTFTLSTQDSGEPGKPIVYRAYPGEQVRILGAKELQPGWFTTVTPSSPVYSRLDSAAQGNVMQVDLGAHGITDYGVLGSRGFNKGGDASLELFFNDQPMQLARWPNDSFEYVASVPNGTYGKQFTYSGTRPQRWALAEQPLFFGYWYYGWAELYSTGAIDTPTSTVTLDYDPQLGIRTGAPYCVLNLLEEIDTPGEWYLNRNTGILYFWPPAPLADARIFVSTTPETLIELNDVSHVTLRDLIIELGWTTLIKIDGGAHNLITHCVVRNGGTEAISISGQNNRVTCSEVYGTGNAAILLSGGDRQSLTPSGHTVNNCHIHHFARWCRTYRPAIQAYTTGAIVSHNLLHDCPHSAILFSSNENLIEYNEIHSTCKETNDSGSIYTGRDWGIRGNLIRYNFFHNIHTTEQFGGFGVDAVALDDCTSGNTIFGNVFYDIAQRAVSLCGGRDHTVENNVIVKCHAAHFTDRRGTVIINEVPGGDGNLLEKIQNYNYTEPPWSTAYPRLAAILDEGYDQAKEPKGNLITRNIGWQNDTWLDEGSWGGFGGFSFYTIENNIEDQDPLFVDEANLNLQLRPESPALTIPGFQPIPFEQIGRLPCPRDCDLDHDDDVDFADFSRFASQWPRTDCNSQNLWCNGADITRSGTIDNLDLATFVNNWLSPPPLPFPGEATNPNPFNGETDVNVCPIADLTWTPGPNATSHDIYFGTTTGPATFQVNITTATFDPGRMAPNSTYYWRIDEINPTGKTIGQTWTFTTDTTTDTISDITGDCVVDNNDLWKLAADWLCSDEYIYPVEPHDANLLLHYKLDENSGDVVADSSGNGNTATRFNMEDADWIGGRFGNALEFDGVDEYIYRSSLAETVTADFSISCWINMTVDNGALRALDLEGFQIRFDYSGRVGWDNGGGPSQETFSTLNIDDGLWHHIIFMRSGNAYQMYIDGRADSNDTGTVESYNWIYLGRQSSGSYFAGKLDDVRIYDYALSFVQVLSLAEASYIYTPLDSPANLYDDDIINFKDFAILASQWLESW